MGKFQAMHKYFVVFLVLLACNDSLLTYGRKIKPLNQHSSLNTHTRALVDNHHPPLPLHVTSFHVPTPTSAKKVQSSMSQSHRNHDVASFEDSGASHTNAFRPTTPGGSPGVGHPKFAEEKDMKATMAVQSPDVNNVSVTNASTNDFRPTDPGNSPGVGHAQHN